jgi:hypothetical protein
MHGDGEPKSMEKEKGKRPTRKESTNLKVVREKEYWLSPMAVSPDYLVGFFGRSDGASEAAAEEKEERRDRSSVEREEENEEERSVSQEDDSGLES